MRHVKELSVKVYNFFSSQVHFSGNLCICREECGCNCECACTWDSESESESRNSTFYPTVYEHINTVLTRLYVKEFLNSSSGAKTIFSHELSILGEVIKSFVYFFTSP